MSAVFVAVVLARLLVPLAIPRYPLPAILAALVIDAADQTIFEQFGGLPSDYQSYDKALDVYYLVVAYAAMLRNWSDPVAFRVGRFLLYYRLAGTVAFELTGVRALLLIFPNTFEYFFIAYETVRVRWDPRRLNRRAVVTLAAGIWIFVKLPQEWWIHIAQLDVTDEIAAHAWIVPGLVVAGALAGLAITRLWPRLPAPDWPATVAVDDHRPARDASGPAPAAALRMPVLATIAEKTLLVGLVSVIFAQVLDVRASDTQVILGVAIFVVVNAATSHVLARRGTRWRTTATQLLVMTAVNAGAVLAFVLLREQLRADLDPANTLFFVLLLSLITTLYDRFRTMREAQLDQPAVHLVPRASSPS